MDESGQHQSFEISQKLRSHLLQMQLTHGHHLYRFLVDGKPFLDLRATAIARNERNEQVSLIVVS